MLKKITQHRYIFLIFLFDLLIGWKIWLWLDQRNPLLNALIDCGIFFIIHSLLFLGLMFFYKKYRGWFLRLIGVFFWAYFTAFFSCYFSFFVLKIVIQHQAASLFSLTDYLLFFSGLGIISFFGTLLLMFVWFIVAIINYVLLNIKAYPV